MDTPQTSEHVQDLTDHILQISKEYTSMYWQALPYLQLLEFIGDTLPIVRVTLAKHVHTSLLDELSGVDHMACNVAGEALTLLLIQNFTVEGAHLCVCMGGEEGFNQSEQ